MPEHIFPHGLYPMVWAHTVIVRAEIPSKRKHKQLPVVANLGPWFSCSHRSDRQNAHALIFNLHAIACFPEKLRAQFGPTV